MKEFFRHKNDFGKLMMLIGILTLVPSLVLPFYPGEKKYLLAFIIPSAASVVTGLAVCLFIKNKPPEENYFKTVKRGSLTVLFAWCYGILAGAIPFLFLDDFGFLQSLFESASGWTTTGFTLLIPEETPRIFVFHRSFMQFCGGLGFILMMAMVIQNKQAINLYNFEGHNDRLSPSVLKTARTIFVLYFCIFITGVMLYLICGMSLFDSVIHCMSALSTGGFSSRAASIGAYDSVWIEIVSVIIMLLGMTNFAVIMLLLKRKFKQAAKVSELKFMGWIFVVAIPIVICALSLGLSFTFGESLRLSVFNIVSVLSTTGFSTVDYRVFPPVGLIVIIILMYIGGAAGSTAGGVKLNRAYLMFRGAGIHINKRFSPPNMIDSRYYIGPHGKTEIDNALLRDTYAYSFIYFIILVISAALLCLTSGTSFNDAVFEAASLSGTVGVSVGIFGPAANGGTLIIGIIGMIIARLEINLVITAVCSLFIGRKNNLI